MNIDTIAKKVKNLKPASRAAFEKNVVLLFDQFYEAAVLRKPYRLVLDSNIIIQLENYREDSVSEGLLSIFLFFDYFRRSSFDADIVVMPSVFYEFLRQKSIASAREHWKQFKNVKTVIKKELGFPALFDEVVTFEEAKHYCELIEEDAKKIEAELVRYRKTNWQFNLVGTLGGEVPPFFAARGLYKELGLRYFNEALASRFLIEHMARNIAECKENDQRIIRKYVRKDDFLLTKVLKLHKDKIKGLADVDIWTRCNVQTQSNWQAHERYVPASIGLSLDRNLAKALSFFSNPYVTFEVASENDIDDNMAITEEGHDDIIRVEEGQERKLRVGGEQAEYLKEVLPLILDED